MNVSKQKISIVVPVYNGGFKLEANYKKLVKYLDKEFPEAELIYVNDGSIDNSREILLSLIKNNKTKLISYSKNRGRGYAITQGFKQAKGDVVGYIDSDLEISEKYIKTCIKKIGLFDGVVVSKHLKGSKVSTTLLRRFASWVFNFWVKLVLSSRVNDHQAGLKFFKKKAVRKVLNQTKSEGWLFDVELLYFLQKEGFRIAEIPIAIKYGFGRMNKTFFIDFLKSFYYVIKLRLS